MAKRLNKWKIFIVQPPMAIGLEIEWVNGSFCCQMSAYYNLINSIGFWFNPMNLQLNVFVRFLIKSAMKFVEFGNIISSETLNMLFILMGFFIADLFRNIFFFLRISLTLALMKNDLFFFVRCILSDSLSTVSEQLKMKSFPIAHNS